jgi:hypothetical protein
MNFGEMKIGLLFKMNGCIYRKATTRTARMLPYGRAFYFGFTDRITPLSEGSY